MLVIGTWIIKFCKTPFSSADCRHAKRINQTGLFSRSEENWNSWYRVQLTFCPFFEQTFIYENQIQTNTVSNRLKSKKSKWINFDSRLKMIIQCAPYAKARSQFVTSFLIILLINTFYAEKTNRLFYGFTKRTYTYARSFIVHIVVIKKYFV